MLRQQIDQLEAFATMTTNGNNQVPVIQGVRTGWLDIILTCTYTIATASATAARNSGSLLGMINEIYWKEGSEKNVSWDPRMLKALTEVVAARTLPSSRLTALTAAAYAMKEFIRIPWAWMIGVQGWRTCYVDKSSATKSYFGIIPNNDAANVAVAGGGGTVAASTIVPTAYQTYDDAVTEFRPYFRPKFWQIQQTVTNASNQFRMDLAINGPIRGLMIMQDNGVTVVNDIIIAARLETDKRVFIGPSQLNWQNLSAMQGMNFGGDVYGMFGGLGLSGSATVFGGMLFLNFQLGGLLSTVLVPGAQGDNLRLVMQVTPSITTGVTTSQITVGVIELQKILNVTTPDQPFSMLGAEL